MPNLFDRPALRPVNLCGRTFERAAHICAFFDSSEQEYACIAPYFAEGLAQGEQVVSIRAADDCGEHLAKLRSLIPVPLDDAIAGNQLRVMASEETYLQDGTFEGERMFRMVESVLKDARPGFTRVRTCGDMSWALRNMPGTEELMEYESRLNELTQVHDCTLMCSYDINRISGKAVMEVLATHPIVIMGDRIYENPYYVEPRSFMAEIMRRGSTPLAKEVELGAA